MFACSTLDLEFAVVVGRFSDVEIYASTWSIVPGGSGRRRLEDGRRDEDPRDQVIRPVVEADVERTSMTWRPAPHRAAAGIAAPALPLLGYRRRPWSCR
ncbi:MAG: hypothetical protein U0800_00315 [Isosphaeraceae bacterium]